MCWDHLIEAQTPDRKQTTQRGPATSQARQPQHLTTLVGAPEVQSHEPPELVETR